MPSQLFNVHTNKFVCPQQKICILEGQADSYFKHCCKWIMLCMFDIWQILFYFINEVSIVRHDLALIWINIFHTFICMTIKNLLINHVSFVSQNKLNRIYGQNNVSYWHPGFTDIYKPGGFLDHSSCIVMNYIVINF